MPKKTFFFVYLLAFPMWFAYSQTTANISINDSGSNHLIDSTFVGFSFNPAYTSMYFSNSYNGNNDRNITFNLLQNFVPFQYPAIRLIGTNNSYWKTGASGAFPNAPTVWNVNQSQYNCLYCPSTTPSFSTAITASDLDNMTALINSLSYRPIVYAGLNLAVIDTARTADFCRNLVSRLATSSHLSFELGNEPDAYISNNRRLTGYQLYQYLSDFNFVADRVKQHGSIVAPALAKANPTNPTGWADSLAYFIQNANPSVGVGAITYHTYPLGQASQGNAAYFLAKYLNDNVTADEVNNPITGILPSVQTAHANNRAFRLAECNTIANGGLQGASNVMGSALWAIDMMFELAKAEAEGINLSTEGGSTVYYSPFTFSASQLSGTDKVLVNPLYYGALLFARAVQNDSRLLATNITATQNNPNLKTWATQDADNIIRVIIINRGNTITDTTTATCTIQLASNIAPATVYALQANTLPALQATSVSLAGQQIDPQTGLLAGTLTTNSLSAVNGNYTLHIRAGNAVLLEIPRICLAPSVSGSSISCETGIETYSIVNPIANAIYTWTVTNGSIQSGQGSSQITVQWNNGVAGTVAVTQSVP